MRIVISIFWVVLFCFGGWARHQQARVCSHGFRWFRQSIRPCWPQPAQRAGRQAGDWFTWRYCAVDDRLSARATTVREDWRLSDLLQLSAGMPQGSYLGSLTFIILIDALQRDVWHTSIWTTRRWRSSWEGRQLAACSCSLTCLFRRRLTSRWWWTAVKKELLIGSVIKDPPPPVNLSGTPVERVTTFELMGVHLASDLKLTQHRRHHVEGGIATTLPQVAETIRRRAWWHAVLLRHGDSDITRVRLSCMTRSLTTAQTKALQSLQRTATRVIFQDSNYTMSLIKAELETLESRRDQLTERFFERSVLSETSCLHYLLPDKLRHSRNFETLKSRTVTFRNSFIPFSVIHYV